MGGVLVFVWDGGKQAGDVAAREIAPLQRFSVFFSFANPTERCML